jgi:endo-1,4-beta-xylanase
MFWSHRLAVVATLAGLALGLPGPAHAQTQPSKYLGSVNLFTDSLFKQYFNQVIPENAGKWGSAAGTTRTGAMRWTQLDQAYNFAKSNGFPFMFHVLLWGNQQPTWMSSLPADQQLLEIKKWFAAVAERYPDIDWLQVVNEATWDPPDCSAPKNQASCNDAGNYVKALGGANDTDGTGWDWVLNAFRLARQYFPHTKLMINDVLITGQDVDTTRYLDIIHILQREHLIDGIGLQAHAFEFTPGVSGPTVPGRPWIAQPDMSVHKANLERLAATGLPIMITELDLDGLSAGGVPGDEVQLADYRRVFPVFWENPSVIGATLWGWKQPSHWRNAQNAPIVLSNGTPKPAALWLTNYIKGIAPVIRPGQTFTVADGAFDRVGTVQADDWASQINRPNLRTFSWQITGGSGAGIFAVDPASGNLSVADPRRLDEHSTYSLKLRVSDGFNTSDEVEASVVTDELANVDHGGAGGTVPATLALALGGNAAFAPFTPGVAKDYESSVGATVTSTAGDATLTVTDPAGTGKLVNGAFTLAQPLQAAIGDAFAPIGAAPLTLHSYDGPVSNDPLTIRFKQAIGASEPLRTGAYTTTFTFTHSTTTP